MTMLEYAIEHLDFGKIQYDDDGNLYIMDSDDGEDISRLYSLYDHIGGIFEISEDATIKVDADVVKGISAYEVTVDEGVSEFNLPKRPYYRMRGKPVTREQAFDIIRRTDSFFHFVEEIKRHPDHVDTLNFSSSFLDRAVFPMGSSWVHKDGTIGANDHTAKFPTIDEFIWEWFNMLYHFPYLDLIIAVTSHDEIPRQMWNCKVDEGPDLMWDKDETYDALFYEGVELGIHVHDKQIRILNHDETIRVYDEYKNAYEKDRKLYCYAREYDKNDVDRIDRRFIKKCIKAYGLDADEILSRNHIVIEKSGRHYFVVE